jgi:hypothetical protein
VDADPEVHAPRFGQAGVALGECALHLDRATHGFECCGKFGEHVVAGCIDHATAMSTNQLRDLLPIGAERVDRGRLVVGHEPAVAHGVGREDRGELVVDGLGRHVAPAAEGRRGMLLQRGRRPRGKRRRAPRLGQAVELQ